MSWAPIMLKSYELLSKVEFTVTAEFLFSRQDCEMLKTLHHTVWHTLSSPLLLNSEFYEFLFSRVVTHFAPYNWLYIYSFVPKRTFQRWTSYSVFDAIYHSIYYKMVDWLLWKCSLYRKPLHSFSNKFTCIYFHPSDHNFFALGYQ